MNIEERLNTLKCACSAESRWGLEEGIRQTLRELDPRFIRYFNALMDLKVLQGKDGVIDELFNGDDMPGFD